MISVGKNSNESMISGNFPNIPKGTSPRESISERIAVVTNVSQMELESEREQPQISVKLKINEE
jgi:hypothetical protein